MRKLAPLGLAAVVAVGLLATPSHAASRPGAMAVAAACAQRGVPVSPVPNWPQAALGPQRAWPFSQGAGIRVAVLDSGVDAGHPQLLGRVLPGYDAVAGGGPADDDCVGSGTQVAGVIAAAADGSDFTGVAPRVEILPIRVVNAASPVRPIADPDVLADGIDTAVSLQADVIAVSAVAYAGSDELGTAVARAVRRGITVVAAVGDRGEAASANPTPYPADYPGVIGVGAIDVTGARWDRSQGGDYVDLVAPGVAVPTLQRGSGLVVVDGTGVACGFVAATAALVRARWGADLPAHQVPEVLLGTATSAGAGPFYGHGLVNPYAAVNNRVVDAEPVPLPTPHRPDRTADDAAWLRSRDLALAGAGAALLATVAAIVLAIAVPRGRRRFWRGTLARRSTAPAEPEVPGPPIGLFEDSTVERR
jgi:hypothetical protein